MIVNPHANKIHSEKGQELICMKERSHIHLVREETLGVSLSDKQKEEACKLIVKFTDVVIEKLQPGEAMKGVLHHNRRCTTNCYPL